MRNTIVFIFYSLGVLHFQRLAAQEAGIKKIDSLNQLLEWQTGNKRTESLIALSEAYRLVSYDKALKSGMEALQYADTHGMERMKAHILRSIGQSAQQAGDFDLALRYYHQSLQIFQTLDDLTYAAKMFNQIGDLKSQLSEYDSALYYFEKVTGMSETLKNDSLLAYATNNSGNVWFETGDLNKAHDAFYKAAIMFASFGDSASNALAEMNLSQVLWQWDENDKALGLLEKTIRFARRNHHGEMLARACSNIGLIFYYDKEDYPKAMDYFQEALNIREQKGHPIPIAHTLVNIANVNIASGEVDKAIATLQRAMQIYLSSKVVQGQVRALYHLGEAYQKKNNFRQSNTYFEQCAAKAIENQIAGYSTSVRDQLMENYIRLNDFPAFIRLFEPYKAENDSMAEMYGKLKAAEAGFALQNQELLSQNEKLKNENAVLSYRLRVYYYLAGAAIGLGLFGLLVFMLWKKNRKTVIPRTSSPT